MITSGTTYLLYGPHTPGYMISDQKVAGEKPYEDDSDTLSREGAFYRRMCGEPRLPISTERQHILRQSLKAKLMN